MSHEGRHITVRGIVQGVGFRPWIFRLANMHGLGGWVRNDGTGVTIEVFGTTAALDAFVRSLYTSPPPAARLHTVHCTRIPPRIMPAFEIIASEETDQRRVSIPADLPTCDDCLAELRDAANRRYRYPFTNCTNCGPRFTIALDVPYDRPKTTMAPFVMCAGCQSEYDTPSDRRFHAQPNACPMCGPKVWLADGEGLRLSAEDAVSEAAVRVRTGAIVAIKGLGGFHLACDATNAAAVAELRARKRRDERPFAVMVADLAAAAAMADLSHDERKLLESIERPIVLVTRRADAGLAANIAPANPLVGLMLPYTPLHHLLLADAGRPLVMTSGNLSEEPLTYRNDDAIARLGSIADVLLLHDRDIDTRCDDSVARVIAGAPVVLRRSRGYVPRGIPVIRNFAQPVLACGALVKNTFCVGTGDMAYLGPHIGDLENLETYEAYEHAIARMERFLGASPAIVAHDLHPDYLSTRYALQRPEPFKVAVQHHHAHIVSAMADRGVTGPVVGVAYDGTGFGTDGTAWGGEILVADITSYDRVGTFRPIVLAGGDLAIRQVWRQALALLIDAFGGDPPLDRFPVFAQMPAQELTLVRQMMDHGVNTVRAHGVGRYFDAVGALGLGKGRSRFEGQIAMEWNFAADPAEDGIYDFDIVTGTGLAEIDLRPGIRELADELMRGVSPGTVSARFHNTVAAATARLVSGVLGRVGRMPVVLSGGVFQNARLAETVTRELGPSVTVVRHEQVPPGDGGIALGQAVIANAVVLAGSQVVSEGLCA